LSSPPGNRSKTARFSNFSFETGLRRIDIRGQSLRKDQNSLQGSWQSAFEARDNFRIADERSYVAVPSISSTTPEPASLILFGSGFIGLAGAIRRKLRA
jgi:hypothetical protein